MRALQGEAPAAKLAAIPGPRLVLLLVALAATAACGGDPGGDAAAPPSGRRAADAPAPAEVSFVDGTEAAGLATFRQRAGTPTKDHLFESLGGGVALVDLDGDGDLDLYLTNGAAEGEEVHDAFFRNDGLGRFEEVGAALGLDDPRWNFGVESADIDGDGRLDLLVTGLDGARLYVQQADGTFRDDTARSGLAKQAWATGACFLDFDRDGDLDLYVVHHVRDDPEVMRLEDRRAEWQGEQVYFGPSGLAAAPDRFYLNRGDGTFEDATQASGVGARAHYGYEAIAADLDEDGWIDVFVANDTHPNLLWRNVRGERFEEVAEAAGVAFDAQGRALAGMGVAVGDVNGDAVLDLFVTNFSEEPSTLYVARGEGRFEDATVRTRLAVPTSPFLGWAAGLDDLDLDGAVDLWCVNGHVFPAADRVAVGMGYAQPTLVFLNDREGRFQLARDTGRGLAVEAVSRGGAAGDVDGDGDLDLVVGNLDGPPTLLVNRTAPKGRSVVVRAVDRRPNTSAHGALVIATIAGTRHVRAVGSGAGFFSCSGPEVHFGLGAAERIDRLEVRWADGTVERRPGVDGGFRIVLERDLGITSRAPLGTVR
jgi:hypothetical protein